MRDGTILCPFSNMNRSFPKNEKNNIIKFDCIFRTRPLNPDSI
ncbi:hypothetical protein LEP1GSC047_3898 [Leptospira inadai serovar Lyme str. 10]|uniref:Uncharacterized protein n=1 Tax=Leptospira inadai serovar Lyme str. 10 TaxID=1049790 RepID=V6HCL9_9LEPT|nr:hypothetical protein LEP1GSC047_3898 [Leptospira inadai serovar Lyme str. 10]